MSADPPPCNRDLFKNGLTIAVIGDTGDSARFERLIQAASKRVGVPIDWYIYAGRAVVVAYSKDEAVAVGALESEVYPVLDGGAPEGTIKVTDECPA